MSEAEKDSRENRHGKRKGKRVGQCAEEDAKDIAERGRVMNDQLENLRQVAHEEHEGK